jgi:hypothetical protein
MAIAVCNWVHAALAVGGAFVPTDDPQPASAAARAALHTIPQKNASLTVVVDRMSAFA